MKNFIIFTFFFIIFYEYNKILTSTSFLKNKSEEGDKLAEFILNELNQNEHEVIESDIFDKEDFSLDDKKNCPEIKKLGQQKKFCEKKISTNEKNEIVDCMKSFCQICCDGENNCHKNCTQSHSLFPDHDPEEMLLSVCSLKNITKSFVSVCDSLVADKNLEEFTECFSNMCFDCCQNELGILDWLDIKMKKCLGGCKTRIEYEKEKILKTRDGDLNILGDNKNFKETNEKNNNVIIKSELSPLDRIKGNFRICGKLVLSRSKSMTTNFGELVYTKCRNNYSVYKFKSSTECLDNLCHDCCNILEEDMKIKSCVFECEKKNTEEKHSNNTSISNHSDDKKENTFSHIKSTEENQTKEILYYKNINDFNLIKSICNTKYFKDCHETLCNDYCYQSNNIIDSYCLKNCNDYMKKDNLKNEIFEHIIKLHGQFKVKFENEKATQVEIKLNKKEDQNEIIPNNVDIGLEKTIEKSKMKIKMLKFQLLEEEKNLLNIYKIKNK